MIKSFSLLSSSLLSLSYYLFSQVSLSNSRHYRERSSLGFEGTRQNDHLFQRNKETLKDQRISLLLGRNFGGKF